MLATRLNLVSTVTVASLGEPGRSSLEGYERLQFPVELGGGRSDG